MRYVGDIYRPPSEAYSLLVQVTIGCSHNKCTFCNMYKQKQFKVRNMDEVLEDLAWARQHYQKVQRIFLCDGDALCLANHKLLTILDYIKENFPECERVTTYGRATAALAKTDEELRELKEHGLTSKDVTFPKDMVMKVIDDYTREAGVRNLERQIASVIRRKAKNIVMGEEIEKKVSEKDLKDAFNRGVRYGRGQRENELKNKYDFIEKGSSGNLIIDNAIIKKHNETKFKLNLGEIFKY